MSVISQHDARTGIQRVVRAVWQQLLASDHAGLDIVPVFARRHHGYRQADPDFLTRPPSSEDDYRPVEAGPGDIFLGLDLAAHLLPRHHRQVRAWKGRGVSINLVIYDLLPLQKPDWFARRTRRNYLRWLSFVARQADRALCISTAVAADLRTWLTETQPRRAIKICVFPLGSDIAASSPSTGVPPDGATILDRMRSNDAVLVVGTIEPRKGHVALLDAFEHLWSSDPAAGTQLFIVGQPGWHTEALQDRLMQHPEKGRRLHWLRGISDEFLHEMYRAARLIVMASEGEGFGLPVVEALSHGRRVLARDLPSLRALGRHPNLALFQSDRPSSLAARIVAELAIDPLPTPAGLPTWADSVEGILTALDLKVAEETNRGTVASCAEPDAAIRIGTHQL
ncbi:MAG: glycosyltransferase family 1 protein [Sphingobium sp.]